MGPAETAEEPRHDYDALVAEVATQQLELEQQNQELRETKARAEAARDEYADLYHSAPIAYCTFDRNGLIAEINRTGAALLGASRSYLVGRPFHAVARLDGSQPFFAHLAEAIAASAPVRAELAISGQKGERELQLVSVAVRAPDGDLRVRTAFLDVTAQRHAEREARAEKALHARLDAIDHAADTVSRALAQVAADDVTRFLQIVVDEARVALGTEFAALGIGGEDGPFDATVFSEHPGDGPAPTGTAFLGLPIVYQGKTVGHISFMNKVGAAEFSTDDRALANVLGERIGVAIEIARLRRAEAEQRAAAERASHAKSEFLSSMSHELRTPLNAIMGFVQLLRSDRKEPLSPRHLERLSHIERGSQHLLQLVEEVLDLARVEHGHVAISLAPVNVADLVAELRDLLAATSSASDIAVVAPEVPPDLHVLADRTRCKQVLVNFGSNAVKYGRPGGRVELRVTEAGAAVRLAVVDDGFGIPAVEQTKVFEPFQRAGRESGPIEGTGIGLALAKRLTELMGGRIGFESDEGRGSTFWIELPVARPSVTAAAIASHARRDATLPAGLRVIYIEDNAESAALLVDLLESAGVAVEVVATAERGLERITEQRPDLVILDVNLPGMSGVEAAQILRAAPATRDLPLVALSAGVTARDLENIRSARFDRHLAKPVDVDALLQALVDLLA